MTYSFLQTGDIRVISGSVFQDLTQQQWVFHQTGTWNVKEAPEVKFSAKR